MGFFSSDDTGHGNTQAGLDLRVAWVKKLRAALIPFASGEGTKEDVETAKVVLAETKEWL